MNTALMFSSQSDEWTTPPDLFAQLHAEFDFQMDLAARPDNALVARYYTPGDDALTQTWHQACARGWCNPPYSRGLAAAFIAKAAAERLHGFLTVMLLPARTDTRAFHDSVYDATQWSLRPGIEVRFLPGRLKFSGSLNAAPFPSMLVVFRPDVAPRPYHTQAKDTMTFAAAARSLEVSAQTLKKWIEAGALRVVTVGPADQAIRRVPTSEVARLKAPG